MAEYSRSKQVNFVVIALLLLFVMIFTSCPPKIGDFTPEKGREGTEITITGENFESTPGGNTVEFGQVQATDVQVVSSKKLIVTVPNGAVTSMITVRTSDGEDSTDKNFVVVGDAVWTFMIYLDADNNLEYAGLTDFREMAEVGSTDDVNIIVQMDRIGGFSNSFGNWTDTRRFLIQQGDDPATAPLQNLGEINMGDPAELEDFVQWSVTNYPAEHYALVIWNHGDGWRDIQERTENRISMKRSTEDPYVCEPKSVASDDTDNDVLYVKEVQNALEAAKAQIDDRLGTAVKLDVVGFDACLMGMIEVAYAMRNVAGFMVGSEELEPGNGWPYDQILEELVAVPTHSPKDLSSIIVTAYGNAYGSGVTQSAVDLSRIQTLVGKINNFTNKADIDWANLQTARSHSLQFHPSWSSSCWGVDLCDFAENAFNEVTDQDLKLAALELKNAVTDFVTNEHHSPDLDGSRGIAIYFPPTDTDFNNDPQHSGYMQNNNFMVVDFVKYNNWDNWLQDYYANIP